MNHPNEDEYVPVNGAIMRELPNEPSCPNDPTGPPPQTSSRGIKTTTGSTGTTIRRLAHAQVPHSGASTQKPILYIRT
ncbi:hypothetical protein [Spirosoma fluviale]|uniref:hypothetical protein n=1 Tax=Spirosoma fluviale TaxID=1597977 RepID=UPI00118177CA|nr:hypothetical protein [Spirosoma fluviale]